jgi:hypothetical protein
VKTAGGEQTGVVQAASDEPHGDRQVALGHVGASHRPRLVGSGSFNEPGPRAVRSA